MLKLLMNNNKFLIFIIFININLVFGINGLQIYSYPPFASVYIDKTFQGYTPLTIPLISGKHNVEVSLEGYVKEIRKVEIANGREVTLYFDLKRKKTQKLEKKQKVVTTLQVYPKLTRDSLVDVTKRKKLKDWHVWVLVGAGCLTLGLIAASLFKQDIVVIRRSYE